MKRMTSGRRAARRFGYLGLALLSGSAIAQQYTVTPLPIPSTVRDAYANAMNGRGDIVGVAGFPSTVQGQFNNDAFLYKAGGSVSDLGSFPVLSNDVPVISAAYGINNCGLVIGSSMYRKSVENGSSLAVSFSNGNLHSLGTFGGSYSSARGINSKNHVAGYASYPGDRIERAFLYTVDGGKQDIGTLGGAGTSSYAIGINDKDEITGASSISGFPHPPSHAFIYSNGAMQDLGTLYGGYSAGFSINADGHVAGDSDFTDAGGNPLQHAFFYSNGVMKDITTVSSESAGGTYVGAMNDYDEIVGEEIGPDLIAGNAFIYSNGTMTDLNTLIGSASSRYFLQDAVAINDRGQIAVNGTDNGTLTVLLLTPVKPSSRVLLDVAANCQ